MRLRSGEEEVRRTASESLAAAYWRPTYCHVRLRWGAGREEAEDLTQEFFLRAFTQGFFEEYEPERGRFRTFLRLCLDRFLAKTHRDATRQKRGGGSRFVPLDLAEVEADLASAATAGTEDPDARFHREWVRSLFSLAVAALRDHCVSEGKSVHFQLFEESDLLPAEGADRPSYRQLSETHHLTVTQVTNYLAFVRREFRRLALERLAELCTTEEEFRVEARELFGLESV